MAYRADIDGLRALAVLAVISFHLNFGVSGGFLGVDVFFVISGYLITRIIVAGIETEEFSILEFYARRARRILPALISTILASSIAAGAILDPPELIAFAKSVIAAVVSRSSCSARVRSTSTTWRSSRPSDCRRVIRAASRRG
ncbi:MAG: acyltransferase, partial [Hyphomicrobiales bacterium]|nr:acyltransferase [Hyphomicrobiales bacterium]